MISLVIDQSQPGVFYLQKMMNFMKPGVYYLQKMMNFMKPGVFYLQKWWISWKCALFIKKLPLFIKKSILHTYKKTQPSNMSFIKNSIFGTFRDPCLSSLSCPGKVWSPALQGNHACWSIFLQACPWNSLFSHNCPSAGSRDLVPPRSQNLREIRDMRNAGCVGG